MADASKAWRKAVDIVGHGYVTESNKQAIATFAGWIYLAELLASAVEKGLEEIAVHKVEK